MLDAAKLINQKILPKPISVFIIFSFCHSGTHLNVLRHHFKHFSLENTGSVDLMTQVLNIDHWHSFPVRKLATYAWNCRGCGLLRVAFIVFHYLWWEMLVVR